MKTDQLLADTKTIRYEETFTCFGIVRRIVRLLQLRQGDSARRRSGRRAAPGAYRGGAGHLPHCSDTKNLLLPSIFQERKG